MAFFANCKNFEISGGEFNEIKGNMNVVHTTTMSATAGSHNFGAGGGVMGYGNAGHPTQFRPAPTNPYHRQQDAPGRSQSYSSAFPSANPRVFNGQSRGWAPRGPQSSGSMRALPDPSTSRPGDEIAAQIRRDERARFVHEASPWPYRPTPPRESHREATAPPLNRHSRAERPSLPIPRSGPSTSPRRDWGENLVSTSPEDAEPPSQWPYPTSQQYPPAPNTHPWSPPAAPRQTPVPAPPVVRSNNSRPQPREDAAVSSSSDSEDEEMEPAPRRRGPQNDWNSGAERS